MSRKTGFTTSILHADREAAVEHGALHKPLHLSVAYGYRDARELAAVFQGRAQGYVYGRQGNPTSAALEEKINRMEDGVATVCFATGMAAIGAILLALLREDDHVVSSAFLFGNTNSMFNTLATHGDRVSFVDATRRRRRRGGVDAGNADRICRDDRQSAHSDRRPGADRRALRRRAASSTSSTIR